MTAPLTLAIDASTYLGTVAVVRGEMVVSEREAAMRGEREERLMPAVAAALSEASVVAGDLTRVVCGGGPGSFTSLRIAASIAKGLCMAHGLPLFTVPSLALMRPAGRAVLEEGRWLALLDAMRGDVYATLLDVGADGRVAAASSTRLIAVGEIDRVAAEFGARPLGAGQRVDARPRASALASVAPELVAEAALGSWEPAYGRLAEAQVKWEAAHGRALTAG